MEGGASDKSEIIFENFFEFNILKILIKYYFLCSILCIKEDTTMIECHKIENFDSDYIIGQYYMSLKDLVDNFSNIIKILEMFYSK
jgi:hypothetical protein